DPQFVDKLRDVVGLYVDPPAHAVVLSVDEKSQIQALDRTQPGLPMKRGRAGTMTHDYKRPGTTTLFAALKRATAPPSRTSSYAGSKSTKAASKSYSAFHHQMVQRDQDRRPNRTVHSWQHCTGVG